MKALIGSLFSTLGFRVSLMWILSTTFRTRASFAVSDSAKTGGTSRPDATDPPKSSMFSPANKFHIFRMTQSIRMGIYTSGVSVSVRTENTSPQERKTSRSGFVESFCGLRVAHIWCADIFLLRSGILRHVLLGTPSVGTSKISIPSTLPATVNTLPLAAAIVRCASGTSTQGERC